MDGLTANSMIDILRQFELECKAWGISFSQSDSVLSYDDSTLFCTAGMQRFKVGYHNVGLTEYTIANVQSCIRLNDIESLGDGTHFALFNMLGLFSFRDWTVEQTIRFWIGFMSEIDVEVEYATVHPNKLGWSRFYVEEGIEVRTDNSCHWSLDGLGGYCTEFYYKGVEIGNIVNPLGTCIDVGFGLERLDILVNNRTPPTKVESMTTCINEIIRAGVAPSNVKRGYVLRKLLRDLNKMGGKLDHEFFAAEIDRQTKMRERYDELKIKHPNETALYWWGTHGINVEEIA